MRCLRIELHDSEIEALARIGWLENGGRASNEAVITAVYRLLEHTLGRQDVAVDHLTAQ